MSMERDDFRGDADDDPLSAMILETYIVLTPLNRGSHALAGHIRPLPSTPEQNLRQESVLHRRETYERV
jgi:hypothetical protein